MELEKIPAPANSPVPRIYIAMATLKNFRGQENVEIQLIRTGAAEAEIANLKGRGLVGAPDPAMPPEVLAGATEENALACLLEAFTEEETEQLIAYLNNRYGEQVEKLAICSMTLPIPLGVGPLALVPETTTSGFINFDQAPGYDLPFSLKGYYDLGQAN